MKMNLVSLKMDEGGKNVIDHINKFDEVVSKQLNAKEIIKDVEQVFLLLSSLPKSLKPHNAIDVGILKLDEVMTTLKKIQRMMGGGESSEDDHLLMTKNI